MKQKHLYSLLDRTYTTIGVVFDNVVPSAPPAPDKRGDKRVLPWGQSPADEYLGQRVYTYKAPRDASVAVDDAVVVFNEERGLRIAKVVRVDAEPRIDVDASFDYKWIVQRVDREAYQSRVDAERVFSDAMLGVERARQREDLLRQFHDTLPSGSEARLLFDRTIEGVAGSVVENTANERS